MKDFEFYGPIRKYTSKGKLGKNYMQKFKVDGETKVRIVSLGTDSIKVAEKRRTKYVEKKVREITMLTDHHYRTANNGIQDALDEYIASHRAAGNTEKQTDGVKTRIERVIYEAGFQKFEDLDAPAVEKIINQFDIAQTTKNRYVEAMKSWTRWMMQEGRWPLDKLVTLKKTPTESLTQFGIITWEQHKKLVDYAKEAPDIRNLTGGQRRRIYQIAPQSGLRAKELASLTPEMFHLDAVHPFLKLPAACSKRGKTTGKSDQIFLNREFANLLRPWLATLEPTAKIWGHSKSWHYNAAQMLRDDLAGAGIPHTVGGAEINFHSFRRLYVTQLILSGAPRSVIMKAARLSTEKLLDTYAKIADAEVAALVNHLPVTE